MRKPKTPRMSADSIKWSAKETDFFLYGIYQIDAVITVLISNIGEYKQEEEGRANDEELYLALQQIAAGITELEERSYEFTAYDLSLRLMWARALAKILVDMMKADEWKNRFSDEVLSGYLSLIGRRLNEANTEANKIHANHFQKAA